MPDLPGSGHSAAPRQGCTIAAFAAALWSLLDHLGEPASTSSGFRSVARWGSKWHLSGPNACCAAGADQQSWPLTVWIIGANGSRQVLLILLIPLLGMRLAARLAARRLFPMPWQRSLRERAAPSYARGAGGRIPQDRTCIDRMERDPAAAPAKKQDPGDCRREGLHATRGETPTGGTPRRRFCRGARFASWNAIRSGSRDQRELVGAAHGSGDYRRPSMDPVMRSAQLDELPFIGSIAEEHAIGPLVMKPARIARKPAVQLLLAGHRLTSTGAERRSARCSAIHGHAARRRAFAMKTPSLRTLLPRGGCSALRSARPICCAMQPTDACGPRSSSPPSAVR